MFSFFKNWFRRHPAAAQAILWAIPAILAGALLRGMLLSYSPYAYWGSDSESYMGFAYNLLERGKISLQEKRRYVYPLLVLIPSASPWGTLKALAWLQHAFGLVTILAFSYSVRKLFVQWRLWIVPLTLLYAVFPIYLWYEHEFLGETLFFGAMVWIIAGWLAWSREAERARAMRLWWLFFIPFAVLILSKPSGRFLWPGVVIALLLAGAAKKLRWHHWAALAAVFLLSLTMGQPNQGAWLLYTSAFPLTRLDTPLHAEYKAEVADMVQYARERIHRYASEDSDSGIKLFLKFPEQQTERPLWAALGREGGAKRTKIYRDLAREAILSRPDLFVYIALQRVADSANPETFKERRFQADYFADRMEHSYKKIAKRKRLVQRLFGLPSKQPAPEFEVIKEWIAPYPDSKAAGFLINHASRVNAALALVSQPSVPGKGANVTFVPTLLGWLVVGGGLLSLVLRRYRIAIGVWAVAMGGYLVGVFLVGSANPRFFALAWPVLFLLAVLPFDALLSWCKELRRRKMPSGVATPALPVSAGDPKN